MAIFNPAFEFVMDHEDSRRTGKVTTDAGGRTRFGIASKFHPELPAEFFTCSVEDGLHTAGWIIDTDYWERMLLAQLVDQDVATKLLDMGVNIGVPTSALMAQRAANGLLRGSAKAPAIDGIWGPQTIAALNGCPPADLITALCNLSKIHYCHIIAEDEKQMPNRDGWVKRSTCRPDRLCDEHQHSAVSTQQPAKAAAGGSQ